MKDDEIIKALKCCVGGYGVRNCDDCSMHGKVGCIEVLPEFALDLINRQKAKIERLEKELNKYPIKTVLNNNCEIHSKTSKDYDNLMADLKAEAIKEFAERLKESKIKPEYPWDDYYINEGTIDALVKEMTEVEE